MLRAWLDKINPPGPAEVYRRQARARIEGHAPRDTVELGALTLFERELASLPKHQLLGTRNQPEIGAPGSLARSAAYTTHLAATLGVSGPLSPAVLTVLNDFRADRLWKTSSTGSRLLGGLDVLEQSQQVLPAHSFTLGGRTIRVTGVTDPREVENLERAARKLQARLPRALDLLETIHLRPFLGHNPMAHTDVKGIAGTRAGQLAIQCLTARTEKGAEGTLYHELGHLLDRHLGTALHFRSAERDTPFFSQEQSVSLYGRTSPAEDLAETHKFLLHSLAEVQDNPDLVHACGAIGRKMAWILDEGYQQPLPGPSAHLQSLLDELASGQTPFGWQTPDGVVGAREDLERSALDLLRTGVAEDDRQEWLQRRLAGQAPPAAPRSLESLHALLKTAADARHALRTGDPKGQRPLMEGCQRQVKRQLEAGGPALRQAFDSYLDRNEPRHTGVRQQYAIISKRLD